jgi:hypothetical protein
VREATGTVVREKVSGNVTSATGHGYVPDHAMHGTATGIGVLPTDEQYTVNL